jgi:hypothetical protein
VLAEHVLVGALPDRRLFSPAGCVRSSIGISPTISNAASTAVSANSRWIARPTRTSSSRRPARRARRCAAQVEQMQAVASP